MRCYKSIFFALTITTIARPPVLPRADGHIGPDRVQFNIAHAVQKILFVMNQACLLKLKGSDPFILHSGDCLVRHIPAQLAHMHGKALGIARVLRQPVKMLYMHADALRTVDTPAFELQIDPPVGNRKITDPQDSFVVTSPTAMSTVRAEGCFFRRLSFMMRAYRSPNTPFN